MDRDEVPFLEPPLGGFSQAQKFEIPHESRFHFRKHAHNTRGITGSCHTQILRSSADWSSNIETEVQFEAALKADLKNYLPNMFSNRSTPSRMLISKAFAMHNALFISRINSSVSEASTHHNFEMILV